METLSKTLQDDGAANQKRKNGKTGVRHDLKQNAKTCGFIPGPSSARLFARIPVTQITRSPPGRRPVTDSALPQWSDLEPSSRSFSAANALRSSTRIALERLGGFGLRLRQRLSSFSSW